MMSYKSILNQSTDDKGITAHPVTISNWRAFLVMANSSDLGNSCDALGEKSAMS